MHWDKLKSIFTRAAGLEPDQRATYLDEACAGEPDLRAEVEGLLAEHADSKVQETADLQHLIPAGQVIAQRFRIVRFVASGGMGQVYEADDLKLGGKVALKTLRPDLQANAQFLGRFRREVHLARQVTHRNICRIFDVGQDRLDGREIEFLTMEYVEGESLAAYLKRHGRLSARAALPLLQQMAAGMTALHECRVIHRDFKPGNVIIAHSESGATRVVITDFGLARAVNDPDGGAELTLSTGLSRSGQILGTPQYMAPEQLTGRPVTAATDIYALGLVMYEMVTGKKPFGQGRGIESAIRRLTEPLPSPTEEVADLPNDWATAILCCLAKEPDDRPATPGEVVEVVEGGATVSLPASALPRRPNKVSRRRWIAAAAALAFFLALFVVLLRVTDQTGEEAAELVVRRHIAVLPFRVVGEESGLRPFADGLMETMTSRLSQFEGPNTELLVVPASEVLRQQAESAGDALKLFGVDYAVEGTLQTRGDRVRFLLTLVDTSEMRQIDTGFVEDLRSNSLEIEDAALTKLVTALNLQVQPEHIATHRQSAPLAPGAYEFYLQARGYLQRSDQIESIDNAIKLLERALEIDGDYALASAGLGEAYWFKYERSMDPRWVGEALASCQRALELAPNLPESHITMGRIHNGTGRYREGVQEYEKALALDNRRSEAYTGLADAYTGLRQFDEAETTYRKAITLRPSAWTSYKQLGLFYYGRGDYSQAIEQYEKVVSLTPDNAQGYVNLGVFRYLNGEVEAAMIDLERALELDPDRVSTLTNLAKIYGEEGHSSRAIALYERALEINDRSFRIWGNLGSDYERAGRQDDATKAIQQAMQLVESELLVNPNRADLYTHLAHYRAMAGQTENIDELLDKALGISPDDPEVLVRAAETYGFLDDSERAVELMRSAVSKGYSIEMLRRSRTLGKLVRELE